MADLEEVQKALKDIYDTVSERDGMYTARRSHPYENRNVAITDMKTRVGKVFPTAEIVYCGSVSDQRGHILHWYVQFTLE